MPVEPRIVASWPQRRSLVVNTIGLWFDVTSSRP